MDPDLPERLLPAREILRRSLMLHPRETAPAMPAGLAADLTARFAARPAEPEAPRVSLLEKMRAYLASPGFGLAAAVVVVVGVAVPMISTPDPATPEMFRGGTHTPATDTVRIAFVGENSKLENAVRSSGHFEAFAFAADADSLPGPKVVIDFNAGTISAVDGNDGVVHSQPLPATGESTAAAVADAILRLSED